MLFSAVKPSRQLQKWLTKISMSTATQEPGPSIALNNGYMIPVIGLGTWQSNGTQAYDAVKYAITQAGYRHIDTAFIYGNEEQVGKAINETIQSGVVKRNELFITTKLWNTFHSRKLVIEACKMSLKQLGLLYLDLYLVHAPFGFKEGGDLFPMADGKVLYSDVDYLETWKGMEDCVNEGLVRSIGVSNFNVAQMERLLTAARIRPVVNQVECHVYLGQVKLIEYCEKHDMRVMAYGALGSLGYIGKEEPVILQDPKVKEVAEKHKKTPAQVLIRFIVQRNLVVLAKSVAPERILSNCQIFDFKLDDSDMKTLMGLNKDYRFWPFKEHADHKYYPFKQ